MEFYGVVGPIDYIFSEWPCSKVKITTDQKVKVVTQFKVVAENRDKTI